MEYNRNIISKWNDVVSYDDTVYVLGGFGICDIYDSVLELKGKIVFLNTFFSDDEKEAKDNLIKCIAHSINLESMSERIVFSDNQFELLTDKDVVLSYFPLVDWYGRKSGSMCFHGMNVDTNMNNGNICCNASKWDFKPVDIDEVKTNISKFRSMV